MEQPEFSDRTRLKDFLKIIEEKKGLIEFIETKSIGEGIVVTIGTENPIEEIKNCSLVISRYRSGKVSGTIGVIGPTRMRYSKLISIVEFTAKSLSESISDL